MTAAYPIPLKIKEIMDEMKHTGLWTTTSPAWVEEYEKRNIATGSDFGEWLQFVYLPNRLQGYQQGEVANSRQYLVPQAIKFFGEDVKRGKLLQLLIELDSLS
ncbi:MAG: YqcC family protein [Bacteroidota bacterium]